MPTISHLALRCKFCRLTVLVFGLNAAGAGATGLELWSVRHNGEGRNTETSIEEAVDDAGNVYLTGGTNDDLLTVKFDGQGTVAWTARWNGPANCKEVGRRIVIAPDGNIVVTGVTYAKPNSYEPASIVVLRYSPEGSELSTTMYPTSAGGWLDPDGFAIDGSGNAFVAVHNGLTKYGPAGELLWTSSLPSGTTTLGTSRLWRDTRGHIYLVGLAEAAGSRGVAIAEYRPDGELQRLVIHPVASPAYLLTSVSDSDHLYITGEMGTLKCGMDGQLLWSDPEPMSLIAVDPGGNVFTATYFYNGEFGPDMVLVKRNAAGQELWRRLYQSVSPNGYKYHYDMPDRLATDFGGSLYVSGGSGADNKAIVLKYDPAGNLVWKWLGNSGGESGFGVLFGLDGRLHVLGCPDCQAREDLSASCLDTEGHTAWSTSHGLVGSAPDMAHAAVIDSHGNCYVAGTERNANGADDLIVFEYARDGREQWRARYPAAQPNGIDIDPEGNVYVAGHAMVGSYRDYLAVKYAPDGQEIWATTHSLAQFDYARDTAVDEPGSVYLAGSSGLVKFGSTGQVDWTYPTNAKAVSIRRGDGVYVAMATSPSSYEPAYVLAHFGGQGQLVWSAPYGTTRCIVSDVATDSLNQAWITGTCGTEVYSPQGSRVARVQESGTVLEASAAGAMNVMLQSYGAGADYRVQRLDLLGSPVWTATYDGPAHNEDASRDLACDAKGNVYVTGSSRRSEGGYDIATVVFNSEGALKWAHRHPGPPGNTDSTGSRVSVNAAGRAVVAGHVYDGATGNDLTAIVFGEVDSPDLDGDGTVGAQDLLAFEACAGGAGLPGPPGCEASDVDRDGDADQSDFGILQRCLGAENLPAIWDCSKL